MNKDRTLVQIALYAAVIAALGLLPKFNIPVAGGVPLTAQTLGLMLAGIMLGPVRGFLSVALFILVVALGAPLLAGGRGGLGVFAGPTVGFIVGFPFAALVTGLMMQQLKNIKLFAAALISSIVGGILVLYAFGIPGMVAMTSLDFSGAAKAILVFIPGDLVKALIAALIAQSVLRAMPGIIASRQT
ncbi:biotin transporter BioY [Neptunomonas japonica]|uniref:Biotin transporter n=1 Tax=Neptunomonas japonica JAMM 1380 TaxID=1441457 RepID=A0A7R6PDN8_9GAMM|nr:biotin transporter BioY [Neptunomonas japonica]BBB28132.1 biotin transport system substrate-specific component [Neptunomonas japonica JAMM 1380]